MIISDTSATSLGVVLTEMLSGYPLDEKQHKSKKSFELFHQPAKLRLDIHDGCNFEPISRKQIKTLIF